MWLYLIIIRRITFEIGQHNRVLLFFWQIGRNLKRHLEEYNAGNAFLNAVLKQRASQAMSDCKSRLANLFLLNEQ
jgi:hypothetical protein